MENKKRLNKGNIFALAFFSVLPVAVFVSGVVKISDGILLTPSIIFAYFILPIIAILLFAFNIFKTKKTWVKVTLVMVALIVFFISFLFFRAFQAYEFVNHYENDEVPMYYSENINELMPRLSEISTPGKIDYYHYEAYGYIFAWESDFIICKYSDEEYLRQKASLEEKYVFQTDAIKDDEFICKPATEIDGYSFCMLSIAEYEMCYPKEVVLIATNDETREISYICYNDPDLDYIDSLEEFILEDCGWKHIRDDVK